MMQKKEPQVTFKIHRNRDIQLNVDFWGSNWINLLRKENKRFIQVNPLAWNMIKHVQDVINLSSLVNWRFSYQDQIIYKKEKGNLDIIIYAKRERFPLTISNKILNFVSQVLHVEDEKKWRDRISLLKATSGIKSCWIVVIPIYVHGRIT